MPESLDSPSPLASDATTSSTSSQSPTSATSASSGRWWLRRDVLEMGVVFVIAVLPALWQALTAYSSEGPERLTESAEHGSIYVFLIQRSISVGIPVLYIMWRSRLGWSFFGLGRGPGIADVLLGAGLVVINYVLFYSFYYAKAFLVSEGPLYPLGALLTDLMPRWPSPLGLASLVLAHTKKRISESLIFCDSCGYDLTGNTSGKCPECGVATKSAAT